MTQLSSDFEVHVTFSFIHKFDSVLNEAFLLAHLQKKKEKKKVPMLDHSAVTGRPTTTCSAPSYADV